MENKLRKLAASRQMKTDYADFKRLALLLNQKEILTDRERSITEYLADLLAKAIYSKPKQYDPATLNWIFDLAADLLTCLAGKCACDCFARTEPPQKGRPDKRQP